ncbi:MAG: flavodoxin [Firmicutes bacterium]|nr:flavodoxin [Bacillota bacterium]
MNTLIAYASRYGCTEKCATILSEKLTGKVDLCNLKRVKDVDLSQYDKVIIGGPVYIGKIQKKVKEFCLKNLSVLKEKKIGLFICGMESGDRAEAQLNACFPQELLFHAAAREFFGGEFKFKKMNPMERFMIRMVSRMDESRSVLDTNKDVSNISEENINRFARLMNGV